MLGFHIPWKTLETEINKSIGSVGTAIVILLLIGLLSGTWTVSGVVPTLIYWGMKIINPYVFLLCCCVISGFVSVMTGSSWTTVATIGIALMGIGKAVPILVIRCRHSPTLLYWHPVWWAHHCSHIYAT